MRKTSYTAVKAVFVAAVSLAAIAWADRPTGTPDCEFDGGAFYKSNNTLYLESFNKDSAVVDINSSVQNCVNMTAEKPFNLVVERNTKLAVNSTLILPINGYSVKNPCIQLYEPNDISQKRGPEWEITANPMNGGNANRAMLMITDTGREGCEDIKEIEFSVSGDVQTTAGQDLELYLYSQSLGATDWRMEGTYSFIKWEEGHPDLGRIYGYAAKDKGAVAAGQFVKVGTGASVPPLRVYLKYAGATPLAKSAAPAPANIELPESIEVRLLDSDGELTGIAKWNMATGEITKVNAWFDLKGRKLNGKPENKGMFVGKKTIRK